MNSRNLILQVKFGKLFAVTHQHMKNTIILLVVLGLGGAWYYLATPPEDFVFDPNPPALTESEDTDESDEVDENSLARELTEEERTALTALQETAKRDPVEVVIATNLGEITLELFPNVAPGTVENFVSLANEGFYEGVTFHRVIQSFMIQGGDPNSKDDDPTNDGQGGPGYTFNDEINPHALGLSIEQIAGLERAGYTYALDVPSLPVDRGVIAMANSGANTNGSQFFIVTESPQPHLNGRHTVFGEVISGMETVAAIAAVETGPNNRPVDPVIIESVTVVDNG